MKSMSKKLVNLLNPKDLAEFLQQPSIKIAEFLTGFLASSMGDWKLSAGRIVQASIKFNLLTQLGRELQEYIKKGRIKEDYYASGKNKASLNELLKFIDNEAPDDERFKAMKSIFFSGVSIDVDARQEEVAYQFLLLCKKLNSIDILILRACYKIYLGEDVENVNTGINAFGDWVNTVSEKIGYGLPELISAADPKLVELGLLSGRTYSDKSGIRTGKEFRLTTLSIKLCEFITEYE